MRIIKIPRDESIPLSEEDIDIDCDGVVSATKAGDGIPSYFQSRRVLSRGSNNNDGDDDSDNNNFVIIDTIPLVRMTHPTTSSDADRSSSSSSSDSLALAGLYAYSISTTSQTSISSRSNNLLPNIRATRLAMACGCHSQRFVGDVWIGRLGYVPKKEEEEEEEQGGYYTLRNVDLPLTVIRFACECSPDIRGTFVDEMMLHRNSDEEEGANGLIHQVPEWLGNASQKNYHDGASLSALAAAMARSDICSDDDEEEEEDGSDEEDGTSSASSSSDSDGSENSKDKGAVAQKTKLVGVTLCLHCRGPTSKLCDGCGGAYFCEEPRKCKEAGWSHECLCSTWRLYVERRSVLSQFPYLSGWQLPLMQEDCFTSETAYEHFLTNVIGVMDHKQSAFESSTDLDKKPTKQNWWATELYGWSAGASASSKNVNHCLRLTYREGFALGDTTWIPKEQHVTKDDIDQANATYSKECNDGNNNLKLIQTDEHGLPILQSWEHYYRLRSLPPSSPVGLIATFPLTIYYAIQYYGVVPLTVAQMLERPLRIHVVGIEKELNFVDLFKEVGYLFQEKVVIDMTWIVREDMFPESSNERRLSLQLTTNLKLTICGGTYGQSLNPNFDMGGPPDMIIGMNAGLFAYESWRHVVSYLHHNKNVLGVFTDYNEHSGMNCASLGGSKAANSLEMNPFRQMRAMPVYCMNLPQFSNGFYYIFNEQELDE